MSPIAEGLGLHGGVFGRVTVREQVRTASAVSDSTLNGEPLSRWRAVPAERSTAIACGELRARTVEHLFAAMAAMGLGVGLDVVLEGPEPPILDGCAAAWMEVLAPLGVRPVRPRLRVVEGAVIDVATSRYTFTPGEETGVSVELELGDARVARTASWGGDAADFRARIAPARTFCFAHEVEELARAGLASHVTPEMVVVLGPEILAYGRPFTADEPARHKILDLVGDLFLYGGLPRGSLSAYRPGHWSTHRAMHLALERGVLAPILDEPPARTDAR